MQTHEQSLQGVDITIFWGTCLIKREEKLKETINYCIKKVEGRLIEYKNRAKKMTDEADKVKYTESIGD